MTADTTMTTNTATKTGITKRLLVLFLLIACGFSSVAFLPHVKNDEPSGVDAKLPDQIGMWVGKDAAVTERERLILGPYTTFARKVYTDPFGDQIFVSIVIAGADMNQSIHRPERCLPAQGWTILDTSPRKVPLANGHYVPITRLHNQIGQTAKLANGKQLPVTNLDYYWFVSFHSVTGSHLQREMWDMRDRFFKGYSQHWAFVTVASTVTEGLVPFGKGPKETDSMIQDFIGQLVPTITKPSVRYP